MRSVRNTIIHLIVVTIIWEFAVGRIMTWFLDGLLASAPSGEYSHLRFVATWLPHLPLIFLTGFLLFALAGACLFLLGKQAAKVFAKWEAERDYSWWYTGRKRSVHIRESSGVSHDVPEQCICGREARSVEEYYDAIIIAGVPVWRFDSGCVPACRHCLSGGVTLFGRTGDAVEQVGGSFDEEMESLAAEADS